MDTQQKYQWLIERAIKRGKPSRIHEAHHVIPKCFMKNDWTVNLTIPEHILAHKYLAEMTDNPKLHQAYYLMVHRKGVRLSNNKAVKAREDYMKKCWTPKKRKEVGLKLSNINKELVKDKAYLKNRANKISLGKWGKVKLEYNGLCYYNKKYIAEDYNVSKRTITNWIQKSKITVIQNKSITYDDKRRNDG